MAAMKTVSPRVSRHTTMWRAGTGFHASHSLGAMLFGLVYGYLALARLYWFKVPFRGILLAACLYAAALIARLA